MAYADIDRILEQLSKSDYSALCHRHNYLSDSEDEDLIGDLAWLEDNRPPPLPLSAEKIAELLLSHKEDKEEEQLSESPIPFQPHYEQDYSLALANGANFNTKQQQQQGNKGEKVFAKNKASDNRKSTKSKENFPPLKPPSANNHIYNLTRTNVPTSAPKVSLITGTGIKPIGVGVLSQKNKSAASIPSNVNGNIKEAQSKKPYKPNNPSYNRFKRKSPSGNTSKDMVTPQSKSTNFRKNKTQQQTNLQVNSLSVQSKQKQRNSSQVQGASSSTDSDKSSGRKSSKPKQVPTKDADEFVLVPSSRNKIQSPSNTKRSTGFVVSNSFATLAETDQSDEDSSEIDESKAATSAINQQQAKHSKKKGVKSRTGELNHPCSQVHLLETPKQFILLQPQSNNKKSHDRKPENKRAQNICGLNSDGRHICRERCFFFACLTAHLRELGYNPNKHQREKLYKGLMSN